MKRDFSEFKHFIKGKKTAVVGLGVSNMPLIDFLLNLGAEVTGFDKKSEDMFSDTAAELRNKGVELILGENYLDNLLGFDVIFKTPSMRIDCEALKRAAQEGAYITSEMEEFIRYCPAKVFGITGSDGKTTTTTLIYNMLKNEGYTTWVGGNIGTPLFTKIEEIESSHKVVLELSSFQLMTMNVSPEVSIITNLSPNHLDMHKGMEEYISAKENIYKYQSEDGLLVLNKDNEITNSMVKKANGRVLQFSVKETLSKGAYYKEGILYLNGQEVCKKSEIKIKGMHNVENYLAAFCGLFEDVKIENMKKVAETFTGVAHRCEYIRTIEGVEYYNDSIASSPSRTLAGLLAFEKPVILIAGGYDKKIPFEPLAEFGLEHIKTLVLVGATKYKIKEAFEKEFEKTGNYIPLYLADTFEDAVKKAKEAATQGDIVTLSPACASFDLFPNFEKRGNTFKEIVNNL
ncbi:MAG: UDP-N-acetylmuramoyl-L-alanine--D-glutamate ligase [Solirubrobacterales bacterium]